MNRYFALSGALHGALALLLLLLLAPRAKQAETVYTIDFIGSGKVVSMQAQNEAAASAAKDQAPKTEPKTDIAQPAPAEKPAEVAKPAKKAYQSKEEIAPKKKPQPKKKEKPAPLAAPSILDEASASTPKTASASSGSGAGDFEGGNVQTDFANFPYPWYITQVRNSLWSQWEKRRPAGNTYAAMVTFGISRNGKIKDLKLAKPSGDDSFDFAAQSAVLNAGPFPPLPMLYEKDELTVTVEFKQEK